MNQAETYLKIPFNTADVIYLSLFFCNGLVVRSYCGLDVIFCKIKPRV